MTDYGILWREDEDMKTGMFSMQKLTWYRDKCVEKLPAPQSMYLRHLNLNLYRFLGMLGQQTLSL